MTPQKKTGVEPSLNASRDFPNFNVKLFAFVAFDAFLLSHGTESLLAIMTSAAKLPLRKRGLGDFALALFHLEKFGMAVGAFSLLLSRVRLVAKDDRARAALGFKLNIAAAYFLRLGVGRA